jgi:hypothetical protein
MPSAHSFGLLHGYLTGDNVLFNEDRVIQICGFPLTGLVDRESSTRAIADVICVSEDIRDLQELFPKLLLDL